MMGEQVVMIISEQKFDFCSVVRLGGVTKLDVCGRFPGIGNGRFSV
jgi:hypothetical protein